MKDQESEFECAVIGRGKYKLGQEYCHLEVSENKWFGMSLSERLAHIRVVSEAPIIRQSQSQPKPTSALTPISAASLCVSLSQISPIVPIPHDVLAGIWDKAVELLSTEGAIASAPGIQPRLGQFSRSGFHTVVPGKGGTFKCENCPNFKSVGSQFIACLKKSKGTPNVTKLVTSDMPSSRGRKSHNAPRKKQPTSGLISQRINLLDAPESSTMQEQVPLSSTTSASAVVCQSISAGSYSQSGNTYNSVLSWADVFLALSWADTFLTVSYAVLFLGRHFSHHILGRPPS